MALLWFEGMEADRTFSDWPRKYEFWSGDFVGGTTGRWAGTAIGMRANPGVQFRTPNLGNRADVVMGCNFKVDATPQPNLAEQLLFQILDGTNEQISLYFLTDASSKVQFRVKRGSTTIGTTTNSWLPGFWLLVEWKVVLDTNGSNGSVELRVNSISELLNNGIDTTNYASLVWNRAYLAASTASPFLLTGAVDDWYVLDTSGSAPANDYLGEIVVEGLFPNGNGNRNQWDTGPNPGGGTHYLSVDEFAPSAVDDDSTYLYVWNADDNKVELFGMSDLAVMVDPVYGVLVEADLKMDNGNQDNFCFIFRNGGGSEAVGSTLTINQTAYKRFLQIYEQDPVASAAWTVSGLNAFQFGLKSLA